MLEKLKDYIFNRVTYKMVVTFTLKSGCQIDVKCDDVKITIQGNEIVGYKLDGAVDRLMYLRIADISAITYRLL